MAIVKVFGSALMHYTLYYNAINKFRNLQNITLITNKKSQKLSGQTIYTMQYPYSLLEFQEEGTVRAGEI